MAGKPEVGVTNRLLAARAGEEIGQLLGRTENAARSLWWRAMQRLQQELTALV